MELVQRKAKTIRHIHACTIIYRVLGDEQKKKIKIYMIT